MADLSDIEVAVREAVQAIRDVLFPGVPVYRGWPAANILDATMKAAGSVVTVYFRPGFARDTTRNPGAEYPQPLTAPSLTVAVAGQAATFAGTCSTDQIAGVAAGVTGWGYRCIAGDTPASVATALAGLSGGTSSGPVVTLTGLTGAATGRDGQVLRIVAQQEVQIAVRVWTATPDQRDAICSAIAAGLSGMNTLTLADKSVGKMFAVPGGMIFDKAENANLYQREMWFRIDYATTAATTVTPVLFAGAVFNGNGALNVRGVLAPATGVAEDASGNVLTDSLGHVIGVYT